MYQVASENADPFTGKAKNIMRDRLASRPAPDLKARDAILLRVVRDGAAWETQTCDVLDASIATISKKKKKHPKRSRGRDWEQKQ